MSASLATAVKYGPGSCEAVLHLSYIDQASYVHFVTPCMSHFRRRG
jgi:hypothetical protein